MKILIVTYSDTQGGAAKALFRIASSLRLLGHDARMLVATKGSDAAFVATPVGVRRNGWAAVRRNLARAVIAVATGSRAGDRSLGIFAGGLVDAINTSDADVVMLGWVGEETLSIAEIAGIRKPLLWRFSDMWPITGTEHYVDAAAFYRYTTAGAATSDVAGDLDGRVFRRKRKQWQIAPMAITPSRWLADCVSASAIAARWPLRVIPTPVDVELYRPRDRQAARCSLGLPPNRRILIFSALHADSDPRKGWDLLAGALQRLDPAEVSCIVVGRHPGAATIECPLPVIDIGLVNDELRMAALYAAADVAVLPSRLDNLPQAGLEAQACGCPVVAFDSGGMRDLVDHGTSGLLATPFDIDDFAAAISAIIADPDRQAVLSVAARQRALALWSPAVTIPRFVAAFEETRQRYEAMRATC